VPEAVGALGTAGGGVVPEYSENKIQMGFLTREACDLMRFRSWENDN